MESLVLVISVIALFAIGYIAVDVLIPDPRKQTQSGFAATNAAPRRR